DDGVQPATEYVHGWDADGCKAFRAPLAEPNKKEYTDDVEVSSSDPKGFIIAKFSEEDVKEIVDMTNEEFEVNTKIRFEKTKGTLWTGKHIDTGAQVTIQKKVDKAIGLVILVHSDNIVEDAPGKKKQILQVIIGRDSTRAYRKDVMAKTVGLLQNYILGLLERDSLTAKRDEFMASLSRPSKAQSSGEAAAASSSSAPAASKREASASSAAKPSKKPKSSSPTGESDAKEVVVQVDSDGDSDDSAWLEHLEKVRSQREQESIKL
ncbi:unnamed protein product, partial [Prorocentrum cordatum]